MLDRQDYGDVMKIMAQGSGLTRIEQYDLAGELAGQCGRESNGQQSSGCEQACDYR